MRAFVCKQHLPYWTLPCRWLAYVKYIGPLDWGIKRHREICKVTWNIISNEKKSFIFNYFLMKTFQAMTFLWLNTIECCMLRHWLLSRFPLSWFLLLPSPPLYPPIFLLLHPSFSPADSLVPSHLTSAWIFRNIERERWDSPTWGDNYRWSKCVLLCVCVNLYALFSVVRQEVLEKWIIHSFWWLIISLCLQQLMGHCKERLCMCVRSCAAVFLRTSFSFRSLEREVFFGLFEGFRIKVTIRLRSGLEARECFMPMNVLTKCMCLLLYCVGKDFSMLGPMLSLWNTFSGSYKFLMVKS